MLPVAAPSAHAATLAELPDGRIAAAWFAGTREGAADVAVWFSTLNRGTWSTPRQIATREERPLQRSHSCARSAIPFCSPRATAFTCGTSALG
ncbi:MAG: exo-alpha-sialidase [Dechloromonas sp.]|uniref:Exo-alpha-sialidase n=1 Tax=Candidatus Dechloromonas phosphorivorans TaxID=2899244 RepID=A0A9D7LM31_9RHOO|nr:exo-alpha-sialidase [Candidatus Dechloromonas phosphorivorans]